MQSGSFEVILFIIIATVLVLGLVCFIVLILLLYQKKQSAFLRNLETLKLDHEKSLLRTELEIQEQTFQNISREIHDNIGLSLTLAKLNLNILGSERDDRSSDLLRGSIELISKAIKDLSDVSKCLNSEAIGEQGFLSALELEINRLKQLNRFAVNFQIKGNPIFFEAQKELVLFRIAQEALNNSIKHSQAKKIGLQVCFSAKEIMLSICDDGKGFEYLNNKKLLQKNMKAGLTNMEIRSSIIDGKFEVNSVLGKGTTVIVTAPISQTNL